MRGVKDFLHRRLNHGGEGGSRCSKISEEKMVDSPEYNGLGEPDKKDCEEATLASRGVAPSPAQGLSGYHELEGLGRRGNIAGLTEGVES